MKYINAYKKKVKNDRPIITARGTNAEPSQDQYFKGALFINTLRGIVNDETKWWAMLRGYYQKYKYQNIMTEDIIGYFNQQTGMDLTPVFRQYLWHTAIPTLELKFDEPGAVEYRWVADEKAFAMPVRVGLTEHWETIHPTTEWQTMKTPLTKDQFDVATDLYYINVNKI
jgi:aminopeptidase N